MNIIEAIKSGKRFRRKGWKYWAACKPKSEYGVIEWETGHPVNITLPMLLASDWEIEEIYYPVSEEELGLLDNPNFELVTPEGHLRGDKWAERIRALGLITYPTKK